MEGVLHLDLWGRAARVVAVVSGALCAHVLQVWSWALMNLLHWGVPAPTICLRMTL
jgi:hypothetical protein